MRARAFVPMFLFAVSLPALAGEDKKEDAIKVDMSYLEKTWGIKCKSHKVAANNAFRGAQTVTFLLEFTKNVENLKELREAFTPVRFGTSRPPNQTDPLLFYFFDEENVFVFKSPPHRLEGEVTGKKGDAIRVSVPIHDDALFKKTRKIVARPKETEKDKDKGKKDDRPPSR